MNEIIKKNGLTFGVIMGLFSVLVTATIYATNLELFLKWWIGLLTIAISIILGVVLVSKTKRELGGQITFKEAFTTYFMAAAIGSTISVLFNILLFNVIDPSIKETLQEMTIKFSVEMMQNWGIPASEINKAVADMQKTDNYAPGNQLFGLVFSLAVSAIFGLILGLAFKSKSTQQL
ncbi:DUF4199 domain-containing protein [Flavobacterium caeni]|uniref:DUF4199 domain-containing protein n=1 Tax=Flavobacterium caeni TaxID=490189 RepID=A0A1G5HMY5_9FLAO|nr:DUF4199 domain-containing protein [Flavobacterium caeni]SCY65146.1 Protein of unknown function [Flavobacterium caeni]